MISVNFKFNWQLCKKSINCLLFFQAKFQTFDYSIIDYCEFVHFCPLCLWELCAVYFLVEAPHMVLSLSRFLWAATLEKPFLLSILSFYLCNSSLSSLALLLLTELELLAWTCLFVDPLVCHTADCWTCTFISVSLKDVHVSVVVFGVRRSDTDFGDFHPRSPYPIDLNPVRPIQWFLYTWSRLTDLMTSCLYPLWLWWNHSTVETLVCWQMN